VLSRRIQQRLGISLIKRALFELRAPSAHGD
jgi:hypothetical protein